MKIVTIEASLLYQILTRYLELFMNYSALKIRNLSAHTHKHTRKHTSRHQLKIIFLDVLHHSEYSDTNISIFFHENSFLSKEAKW